MDRQPASEWIGSCSRLVTACSRKEAKGLNSIIEELKDMLFNEFPQRRAEGGVLLYGPAGVGKTLLMQVLQAESPIPFLRIPVSDLTSQHSHTLQDRISALLQYAQSSAPIVVFLDEIDLLYEDSGDVWRNTAREILLDLWKGGRDIRVVAATARPWRVNPSLIRRLQKRVFVGLPSLEARKALFEAYCGHIPLGEIEELASRTDGYSGADIAIVSRDANMQLIRKIVRTGYVVLIPEGRETVVIPGDADNKNAIPLASLLSAPPSHQTRPPTLVIPISE